MPMIGYARVSSREQAENSHALEQQINRLKAAGATEIITDIDSGSRDSRPGFLSLLTLPPGSTVVVTRLDRLTRSLPTLRRAIAEFQRQDITLIALDDAIDTGTAAGKFQLNILGALAEMETDRLSERVRHGWAHLRDRRVAMNPPFGYRKVNDRLELDYSPFLSLLDERRELSRAEIARDIINAFLTQKTLRLALREINQRYGIQTHTHQRTGRFARDLFRFSPGGLRNWLTNPVLQGHLSYLRRSERHQIIYNTHEPLITPEQAQEINEILTRNALVRGYGTTAQKYPLSGLVFCGECGGACYSVTGTRGKTPGYNHYFQCKNWRTRGCSQKSVVRMDAAEAAVIAALMARSEAIANIAATPDHLTESPELQALRQELAYYAAAPGNRAAAIVADLQAQINFLIQQQGQAMNDQGANRELLVQCFSDRITWEQVMTVEDRREVYRALVDRVTVRGGQVESVSLKV